jgi:hypothetical protein
MFYKSMVGSPKILPNLNLIYIDIVYFIIEP